ncbi:MAG: hypothetical protein QOD00_1643 [Blastocatellia bacterium]|jgi:hypothetical protein|nr:hypothetical protein [Blastocatellia bacterium]
MATIAVNKLSLAPLGAGDLIDRAVRLYRLHFMTLIRITTPPVVISAVGSVLMTIGWRAFSETPSDTLMTLYFALLATGGALFVGGNLFGMIVMGGATHNLVMNLLWNEPVTARATYKAVRARFWGLLFATLIVGFCVALSACVAFVAWYLVFALSLLGFYAFSAISSWVSGAIGVVGFILATLAGLYVFFILAGKFAYVPQALLVEGKGISAAISRSTSLARGNVRRLMAITFFCSFATYSALMILIVPLGWYGYLHGIDPSPMQQAQWPAWYAIGYNVLWQSSLILLAPVWMLGLSLLYVDERVRQEGYDLELMAARQLGEMPHFSANQPSPFAPAIVAAGQSAPPVLLPPTAQGGRSWSPPNTLGLH